MKGRFLLHYCDPTNWRLRNVEKHPCDPGWEVGSYSVCHPKMRPKIDVGTKVFDVVVRNGKGIIRSAFVVSKTRDISRIRDMRYPRILYFEDYYFADDDPIELPGDFIQYRCIKMETWIKKYKQNSPWNEITREYAKYKKGQKPKSIDSKSWNNMVTKTTKIRNRHQSKKPSCARHIKRKCK